MPSLGELISLAFWKNRLERMPWTQCVGVGLTFNCRDIYEPHLVVLAKIANVQAGKVYRFCLAFIAK